MLSPRYLFWVAVILITSTSAQAHFIFIVPSSEGDSAQVIFSETLQADDDVALDPIRSAKIFTLDANGEQHPVTLDQTDEQLSIKLERAEVIYGSHAYGVTTRGSDEPYLLMYHPKTVLGNPFRHLAYLSDKTPVEIVAFGEPGDVVFQMLHGKKSVANAELTVILPNGEQQTVKTNAEGKTEAFAQRGRYGVWGRYFEATSGKHGDKDYQQVRHYPTLVIDVSGEQANQPAEASAGQKLTPLPVPTSSFGAVACDGWLYVYGGHVAPVHTYSTEAVSGKFWRMPLADGRQWEELPAGPRMQGMNLAADDGKIYRVGGMVPKNALGTEADNWSTDEAAVFDPETKTWQSLPNLPAPRSSHDLAIVNHKLYVLGGWNMLGAEGGTEWLESAMVLDLAKPQEGWREIPQPFSRRALIVATLGDKIYVIGGFTEDDDPSLEVDIFDTVARAWSKGPQLPKGPMNGFAPAACVVDDDLYASVADGALVRLSKSGDKWETVAKLSPRIVHRLIPRGDGLLLVGGAAKMQNLDTVEFVDASLLDGK